MGGDNMLKEKITERQLLREKVLSSLYDYYFDHNGVAFRMTKEELKDAPEERLSYDYLEQKGLIHVERQGIQNLLIRITVHGIDVFEQKFLTE
jgi:hypothetical protein